MSYQPRKLIKSRYAALNGNISNNMLIGTKGNNHEAGYVFMPYIMVQNVAIVSEYSYQNKIDERNRKISIVLEDDEQGKSYLNN